MKRLIFIERALHFLFNDGQMKGLHLHKKLSLSEATELRKNYDLKHKLKKAQSQKKEDIYLRNELSDSFSRLQINVHHPNSVSKSQQSLSSMKSHDE
jgi:hypothetical protein